MKMQFLLIPVLSIALLSCERTDKAPPPPQTPTHPQTNFPDPYSDQKTSFDSNLKLDQFGSNNTRTDVNNTRINVRDRDSSSLTPLNQSENQTDLTVTQKIRQAIMADSSLSTNAKNVKIITVNGVVTLRGPVANAKEKESIANKASSVDGVRRVDNQLDISR